MGRWRSMRRAHLTTLQGPRGNEGLGSRRWNACGFGEIQSFDEKSARAWSSRLRCKKGDYGVDLNVLSGTGALIRAESRESRDPLLPGERVRLGSVSWRRKEESWRVGPVRQWDRKRGGKAPTGGVQLPAKEDREGRDARAWALAC